VTKDEESALQWAIDFFRKRAADMTRDGGERGSIVLAVNTMLSGWIYDAERHPAEEMDARTAKFINEMCNRDGAHLVAHLAATLMERGDQLPKSMRDFVIDFLRDPKLETGKRGPKRRTLLIRDMTIGVAVGVVAQDYGFAPTRNRAARRPCAASIVQRALAESIRLHLSEADVVRLWGRFRKQMKAPKHLILGGITVISRPSE
jgi:hypothetical protein